MVTSEKEQNSVVLSEQFVNSELCIERFLNTFGSLERQQFAQKNVYIDGSF